MASITGDPVGQREAGVAVATGAALSSRVRRRPLTVVCVTPVKNEAWILERFLRCAETWADQIILADQGSTDGTRDIAERFDKVTVYANPSPVYDEAARQRLLIDAARTVPGPRLILALDADEMLSANWSESPEWHTALQAPPGTVLRFQWANVMPDFRSCWIPPEDIPFGFVDDGGEHRGCPIHSTRVPVREAAPSVIFRDIKVLHYQYTDWQRMKSKQRWYQCWEAIHNPGHRPVGVYRQYHRMEAIPPETVHPLRGEWLELYQRAGIDMTTTWREGQCRFAEQTLEFFRQHGAQRFRKVDVWDVDWREIAARGGRGSDCPGPRDPRTPVDKLVHLWLKSTQRRYMCLDVRIAQRLLRLLGW
jgi:hypothetical protein